MPRFYENSRDRQPGCAASANGTATPLGRIVTRACSNGRPNTLGRSGGDLVMNDGSSV
jgi:hypothetical protein